MARVRISNSTLNSYSTRILTPGLDVEQYKRNPVLLYMHERGKVIGFLKDIKVEGDDVTAEPYFDEVTELSRMCKAQFEKKSLRMFSIGIDIVETSEEAEYMLPGQRRPSITKSKLTEVSFVDIGANDDALVLMHEGKRLTLSPGDDNKDILPIINQNNKSMNNDLQTIALALGLSDKATREDILSKINSLLGVEKTLTQTKQEVESLRLASITQLVDAAVAAKKVTETNKAVFVELGKKAGIEDLKKVLESMSASVKVSDLIGGGGAGPVAPAQYKKLSDVPEDKILDMRKNDQETYRRLYKAEFGIACPPIE